jgi:branched-chain amino acid transport system ATP-binding protein
MLTVQDVDAGYFGSRVLVNVSLKLGEGELVCLLGANGAGKSTLLKVITGLHRPAEGKVEFRGKNITHVAAHKIAAMGIVMIPEGRRLFPFCTVLENLELGGYARGMSKDLLSKVFHMFPRLEERKKQMASTLSGGEQQMLTFGRAMMAKPEVLLLDEPSLGLAPLLVREIFAAIETIHRNGVPTLLVEQNAARSLAISDRGYIMETGKIVLAETSENLRNNPLVLKAYLGGEV